MQFTCPQTTLAQYLSQVIGAVPHKPSHPVLGNILLQADQNQISLTAFDLSLGITAQFEASIAARGAITLPAKLFHALVESLPNQDISLKVNPQSAAAEHHVTLTCEGASYQLQGLPATDFPEFPQLGELAPTLTLAPDTLIAGLVPTLSTCATDATKQILTGVHFQIEGNSVEFVGIDGHRLALVKRTTTDSHPKGAVTIPGKALTELLKLLKSCPPDAQPSVSLSFEENQVIFTLPTARLFCRSLAGAYPAYGQLIPQQFQVEMNAFTQSLKKAVQRLMLLNASSPTICLAFDYANQQLNLSSLETEIGKGIEAVPAQVSQDFQIALNGRYLLEALKSLPSREVQLSGNFSTTPALLKAVDNDLDSCFVLLMPLFVQGFSEVSAMPEQSQTGENVVPTEKPAAEKPQAQKPWKRQTQEAVPIAS